MAARWTLFCAMIDNYGDLGVCWRLARQLSSEHGLKVDLWIDDWGAAGRFLCAQQPGLIWSADNNSVEVADVQLRHWQSPWPEDAEHNQRIAASDCVIEAFACELPLSVKQAFARRQDPLVWINLEYLSAEDWVGGCHGLPSPQPYAAAAKKFFFFPGFTEQTGGLLRERGLLQRHADWQAAPLQNRRELLAALLPQVPGEVDPARFDLLVSVFSYETRSLDSWLAALAAGSESVLCLIPEGRSLQALAGADVHGGALQAGSWYQQGRLTVLVLPFMSQDQYDQLLSLSDFSLTRGEDSFVRAQWAAKPFIWHIYPQDDGVHLQKLQAFADLYLQGLDSVASAAWSGFAQGWNQGEDCRDLWHYLRPQLPDLLRHARKWQQKLAEQPDLASNLLRFVDRPRVS